MATIGVLVSQRTLGVSLGAMIDCHARLGEVFESNEALGAYARMETRLEIASTTGAAAVEMAGGRPLGCDVGFAGLRDLRMVYLPAFQVPDPEQIGQVMDAAGPFHAWLRGLAMSGVLIGAAGASVFHLAQAGLLDGLPCAVSPRLSGIMRQRRPRVLGDDTRSLIVGEGIMTCSRDWHCGALVLRMLAEAISPAVARSLGVREPPAGETGLGEQEADPLVARARLWIRDRFARDFRIEDLARQLGISHQSLIRRFRASGGDTPRAFAQRLRIDSACSMLRETRRPVSEIAQLVGYRDIASFRQVFAAQTGMSPARYRRAARP